MGDSSSRAPSAGDEPAVRPKKRRIQQACKSCSVKRVKCDGQNPCTTCQRSEELCEYGLAKKRGPPKGSVRARKSEPGSKETQRRKSIAAPKGSSEAGPSVLRPAAPSASSAANPYSPAPDTPMSGMPGPSSSHMGAPYARRGAFAESPGGHSFESNESAPRPPPSALAPHYESPGGWMAPPPNRARRPSPPTASLSDRAPPLPSVRGAQTQRFDFNAGLPPEASSSSRQTPYNGPDGMPRFASSDAPPLPPAVSPFETSFPRSPLHWTPGSSSGAAASSASALEPRVPSPASANSPSDFGFRNFDLERKRGSLQGLSNWQNFSMNGAFPFPPNCATSGWMQKGHRSSSAHPTIGRDEQLSGTANGVLQRDRNSNASTLSGAGRTSSISETKLLRSGRKLSTTRSPPTTMEDIWPIGPDPGDFFNRPVTLEEPAIPQIIFDKLWGELYPVAIVEHWPYMCWVGLDPRGGSHRTQAERTPLLHAAICALIATTWMGPTDEPFLEPSTLWDPVQASMSGASLSLRQLSHVLAARARLLLEGADETAPQTIAAYLYLLNIEWRGSRHREAERYGTLAIRAVLERGWHRSDMAILDGGRVGKERIGNRLFWVTFACDKYISMAVGRPPFLRYVEQDCPFPDSPEEDALAGDGLTSEWPRDASFAPEIGGWHGHHRLLKRLHRGLTLTPILEGLLTQQHFNRKLGGPGLETRESATARIEAQLAEWEAGTPFELLQSEDPTDYSHTFAEYVWTRVYVIQIQRPFPGNSVAERRAFRAAVEILEETEVADRRFGLCAVPSINTYVIFAAGSVLVSHAAGLEGDGSNIALASYWLRQALTFTATLSAVFADVVHLHETLKTLAHGIDAETDAHLSRLDELAREREPVESARAWRNVLTTQLRRLSTNPGPSRPAAVRQQSAPVLNAEPIRTRFYLRSPIGVTAQTSLPLMMVGPHARPQGHDEGPAALLDAAQSFRRVLPRPDERSSARDPSVRRNFHHHAFRLSDWKKGDRPRAHAEPSALAEALNR